MCPVTRFFAVETILSFWWDLESFEKKKCDQLHVFSLWRLTWVFDGTWKIFHKKVCPVTRFFAVETILSFWWDLESFDKKVWSVTRFFAVQAISSFWWDLEKFSQKSVPSYTFCSLWSLTWVFDGTWKSFHKKSVPSHRFLRCTGYLKFLMGLGNIFTKKVCPVTRFFTVETNLSFLMGLGKMFKKKCAQSQVSSLWRLTWVFDAT